MKMSKLLALALVLLISVGTLAGSTIAWFTDTVTSEGNVITAGELKAEMWYKDEAGTMQDASTGAIFDYQNWEPGYTQVKELTLKNVGSLAFKYDLRVYPDTEVVAGETNLADVIEVYYGTGDAPKSLTEVKAANSAGTISAPVNEASGILLPAGATPATNDEVAGSVNMWIALHMKEEAGNEYQGLSVGDGFAVQMLATQYTYENDSFGNTYDEGAEMPEVAANTAELVELLNDGKSAKLTANLALKDAKIDIPAGSDVTLDLNGYTITGQSTSTTSSTLMKVNAGSTLTLKNGTVAFAATEPDVEWGGEGQPAFPGYANNTINVAGKLVIDGATVKNMTAPGGASYAIDCYPGADLIINSGTIDGCGKTAIRMFCNSNTVDTKVTVNGGTVTGSRAIWVQLPSAAASNGTPNVQKADLTINGGKLVSTDETYNLALYVYSYGSSFENTKVTLNGGTYYGNVIFGGHDTDAATPAGKETIVINKDNCKFYGKVYSYLDSDKLNSDDYTSAGETKIVDDASELKDAFDANDDKVAIVLTDDVELNANEAVTVAANKEVNLELNGNTISSAANDSGNQELFLVKGTMNVSNGTVTVKAENNQGWDAMNTAFDVTAGGVLNIKDATIINEGGTDMGFCVHLNNWGDVTLNIENSVLKSNYCAVRVFNSGYDMNNVTIKNSVLHGDNRAFWVQNYIGDLNSTQHTDEAIKSRLNIDLINGTNTITNGTAENPKNNPIRYGFGDQAIYYDAQGNDVTIR